jgi:predicted nuclease of predicted toxin-antitoxin system
LNFLLDAQLPRRAVQWFANGGASASHTLELPDGNRTTDAQIIAFADANNCIVVTKDADFVDSHALHNRPAKLLLISTGNVTNAELEALIVPQLPLIIREFQAHVFLELSRSRLIIRA